MVSGFVDLSLLDLTLSQARRKGQFFIAFKARNSFGQVIFKPEVCKSFETLIYCMSTSPVPSSVWYLQWRVHPSSGVFYSVFIVTS